MPTSYRPIGLVRYHAAGAYRGYILFSPSGGDDACLLDNCNLLSRGSGATLGSRRRYRIGRLRAYRGVAGPYIRILAAFLVVN